MEISEWEMIDDRIIRTRIDSVVQATDTVSRAFSEANLEQLRTCVLTLHHAVSGSLGEFDPSAEVDGAREAVRSAMAALRDYNSTESRDTASELLELVQAWL